MNRLSPLIVRRVGPAAAAATLQRPRPLLRMPEEAPAWLDDLRLFATAWAGGMVFFGTYLA